MLYRSCVPGRCLGSMGRVPECCTYRIKAAPRRQITQHNNGELRLVYRYYVLVATCVFARKAEWLRNACLAAALLFPAVAALHGIVLACVHVNGQFCPTPIAAIIVASHGECHQHHLLGAVDMDIYGAFQLCCIGILAAPVTVRLSRTYFHDPGRNIIFLWTGLILAGKWPSKAHVHAYCVVSDMHSPCRITKFDR